MSNTNAWANRTKQALTTVDTSNLKPVGGGGGKEINKFYQLTPVKAQASEKAAQLNVGDIILGKYEGSFVTKKFNTTFYKVQTQDKGLVAVPGSGQLKSLMAKVVEGSDVQITYNGKETIEKGPMAGKQAHKFFVAASELKQA